LPIYSLAWSGQVVGISDGDTITVLNRGKGEKIRLYGIDAPEMGQDFSKKAKWFLSDLIFSNMLKLFQRRLTAMAELSLWYI